MSLRDLYDAVTGGLYGGRTDPVTGLPYRLQDSMPEAVLTQCRHWVNYPQVPQPDDTHGFILNGLRKAHRQ